MQSSSRRTCLIRNHKACEHYFFYCRKNFKNLFLYFYFLFNNLIFVFIDFYNFIRIHHSFYVRDFFFSGLYIFSHQQKIKESSV